MFPVIFNEIHVMKVKGVGQSRKRCRAFVVSNRAKMLNRKCGGEIGGEKLSRQTETQRKQGNAMIQTGETGPGRPVTIVTLKTVS